MKSYLYIFIIFALFGACATDDAIQWVDSNTTTLKVDGVYASSMIAGENSTTRATALVTGFTANSSTFGLRLENQDSGASDYSGFTNVSYTYQADGSLKATTTGQDIKLSANKGKLYAIYPYQSADYTAQPVAADGVDYMVATPIQDIVNSKSSVSLSMRHALSLVKLVIKRSQYTGVGKITSVSLTSNAFRTSGTLDGKTGIVKATTEASKNAITPVISSKTIATGAECHQDIDLLLVPSGCASYGAAGTAAPWTFSIVVDGNTFTVTSNASYALTQGKKTTFTLSLNNKQLIINGVELQSWSSEDKGSTNAECVTQSYVDLGLPSGTLWATCNVGANSPEEFGDYFAWGQVVPYYAESEKTKLNSSFTTIEISNWNIGVTLGNGNQLADGGYTSDNYWGTGATFTPYEDKVLKIEFDAAAQRGSTSWRMPTAKDMVELDQNCITAWTDSYKGTGVKGRIFFKYKSGQGTAGNGSLKREVTTKYEDLAGSYSYDDVHIFLPEAGYFNDLKRNNWQNHGYYWLSTLSSTPDKAYCFRSVSDEVVLNYPLPRYYGMNIRPVSATIIQDESNTIKNGYINVVIP